MKEETMKSLRMLASIMLALLLAFSTTPALISADSQHQPQHEPKKEKTDKDNKDDSKKEKDSKKDKDKVDKGIDDLEKALEGEKEKKPKKEKEESKKEKDSEKDKNDSGKEKDAKNDKSSGHSDYEGTYIGNSASRVYEIELKLEKAKKGPLYAVEGTLKQSAGGFPEPGIYSVKGSFSPKTGKLNATYKAQNKNALGKGNVDGEYEDGSFTIKIDKSLVIQGVTKQ